MMTFLCAKSELQKVRFKSKELVLHISHKFLRAAVDFLLEILICMRATHTVSVPLEHTVMPGKSLLLSQNEPTACNDRKPRCVLSEEKRDENKCFKMWGEGRGGWPS